MKEFNKAQFVNELYERFEVIDNAVKDFSTGLCADIFTLINKSFKHYKMDAELKRGIEDKVIEIYHSTQSLIDKDKTYPDYRMNVEIGILRNLIAKRDLVGNHSELEAKLLYFIKFHIVEHFKEVYDLSAEGYLLIDLYVKYHFQDLRQAFYDIEKDC